MNSAAAALLLAVSPAKAAGWVLAALAVLLFFSLSIIVHEGGHFLAARALGLRATAFSIGFGPALWKRKRGETEYKVCAIPFGGYVALPQLDPAGMQTLQGGGETAPAAVWWKRVLVAVAGPAGNVLFAIPLAFLVRALPSVADPHLDFGAAVIGEVVSDSAAARAGLRPGDVVLSVSGRRVSSWQEFVQEVHLGSGAGFAEIAVSNAYDRAESSVSVPVEKDDFGSWSVEGVSPAAAPGAECVFPSSPAYAAGLREGDVVLSACGRRPVSSAALATILARAASAGRQTAALEVLRRSKGQEVVHLEMPLAGHAAPPVPDAPGCVVRMTTPGFPAQEAGLQPGDAIVSVDGVSVASPSAFVAAVKEAGCNPIGIGVVSYPWTDPPHTVEMAPRESELDGEPEPRPIVGAIVAPASQARWGFLASPVRTSVPIWSRHRAPLAQLKGDAAAVWRTFAPFFGKRSKGEIKRIGTSLGGPVIILSSMWFWILANFSAAVGFVRFLNVNLAIVNLLPIPVLDGGHVVFALWRGATGREMPRKLVDALVNVFGILIIAAFVLLSGCDAARLWRRFS
ncbi:MAG: site-2 protease family protein [Kiritimatiellae bacterium]|nr:site-2 protease family protein [Kiritimatiellia bacterium]